MNTTSILNPDADEKLSNGETVTVRELKWKKFLVFNEKFSEAIKTFVNDKGEIAFDMAKIKDIVTRNADLAEWIAMEATGKNKAWLEELTLGDMAKITARALVINLTAVAEQIKNVRSRLADVAAGAPPMTSSVTQSKTAT